MPDSSPPESLSEPLRRLVGYLNFSSGASGNQAVDPSTMAAWNMVYGAATEENPLAGMPAWLVVKDWLRTTVRELSDTQAAFQDTTQAEQILRLLWSEMLPAYMDFHRDLLFHREAEQIFNGFFIGQAADAILGIAGEARQHGFDDATIIQSAIDRLDNFVGYRPVAMLENRRCYPYRNEFVCPIPLYVAGVGVSSGPYREIITLAIEVLKQTDPAILRSASFHPERLQQLCLDPRAYDFDHPVNRRPNYHFGGWDEGTIDADGFFYRFVIREVTVDALISRIKEEPERDRDELLLESASVLAGTILMASGISGWGPGAYTSDITLGSLMKPIAAYRDAFYEDRLSAITGDHGQRLAIEAERRHQPFGRIRQHLNASLARRRAAQLQHVQLARLYARMGYPEAAKQQLETVPATSARMVCRIDCAMTIGLRRLREGDLKAASEVPSLVFDLLKRAIECGGIIDPWDILGSGGNFSLYPGPESGVHDTRVDDVIFLVEQMFGYIARVWSEAAAQDHMQIYANMELQYRDIAEWWRQFAAHTVDSVEATDPLESYDSAKLVARALQLWHQGGAEAGNVKFWAPHADLFDSPRAYALVISALLEREDFVPAMALLVHWLSNADRIGLRTGGTSLPRLSERWLLKLRGSTESKPNYGEPSIDQVDRQDTRDVWPLARKFFDYLEANAEQYWSAPQFMLADRKRPKRDWDRELETLGDEGPDDESGLFDAAYEGMSYRDTTDDGNDGAIYDPESATESDELEPESKRLIDHLNFLQSLARMWSVAADIAVTDSNPDNDGAHRDSLESWARRAKENRIGLLELLDSVRAYAIAPAGSDKDSMRSYDRSRVIRDSLMERIINTAVEMSDARRLISGALISLSNDPEKPNHAPEQPKHAPEPTSTTSTDSSIASDLAEDDAGTIRMFGSLIGNQTEEARSHFPAFLEAVRDKNLLYIPVARGGDPVKIYVARLRQRALRHLMYWLPRRGLIAETCQLLESARQMEQSNPIGIGAVTEFDSLFKAGFRSLVASIVQSAQNADDDPKSAEEQKPKTVQDIAPENNATDSSEADFDQTLIDLLERLTETLLASWLAHSQTLRLSPLETVTDPRKWERLVVFIKKYGDPIFTQTFLQLGNVRAILHQGVGEWLQRAIQHDDDQFRETLLFRDIESGSLQIGEAERWMTLVYESLIDHHAEYLDYNSTTTQSDRGDLVYMFLDFLRLRVRYERIAWNLKPVMWAHEVLVRSDLGSAASMWRRSLIERIGAEADVYLQRLQQLRQTYAMRMPTVADRINERFVQPMTIDRMRALIGPAMRDAEAGQESKSFSVLEDEVNLLTRNPTGVGLDLPVWLNLLEEEVEQLTKRQASSEIDAESLMTISITPIEPDELNSQLIMASSQGRRLPHMK